MSPVYVVHHIAYDCGDEASLNHQLVLHVDADDNDDDYDDSEEEDDNNIDEGPLHTHSLFAFQGYGREAKAIELFVSIDYDCFSVPRCDELLLLFTLDNLQDGTFQHCETQGDRLSVTNGIIAIPPFMTVALMPANSSDSKRFVSGGS